MTTCSAPTHPDHARRTIVATAMRLATSTGTAAAEAVPHGNHTDYRVSGHLHHPHGDHCDDHGPLTTA